MSAPSCAHVRVILRAVAGSTPATTSPASPRSARREPSRERPDGAHSPQDTGGGKAAPLAPVVTQPFVDDGTLGDLQAGDGVYTARLDPLAEGFGNVAGMIRTELIVQSGQQQGYVAFDVVYTPQVPATWAGPVRDALQAR